MTPDRSGGGGCIWCSNDFVVILITEYLLDRPYQVVRPWYHVSVFMRMHDIVTLSMHPFPVNFSLLSVFPTFPVPVPVPRKSGQRLSMFSKSAGATGALHSSLDRVNNVFDRIRLLVLTCRWLMPIYKAVINLLNRMLIFLPTFVR